jgi:hypothetical protein
MGENQTAAQFKEYVLRLIDNLSGHAPLAPDELREHEFLCTKDLIRGAFVWATDKYKRGPHIRLNTMSMMSWESCGAHVQPHDGDIIEIRVVERAKP